MNKRIVAVLYLSSVVCAFYLGGYVSGKSEATGRGVAGHVDPTVLEFVAKLVAPEKRLAECDSHPTAPVTLARVADGVLESAAAQDRSRGRFQGPDQPDRQNRRPLRR